MSKEEFMKIQTCVLKVNIHCDGCKDKVKKILQKIDGVFKTSIDSEQGRVTVSGNVDPNVLIKKLAKSGKHAELWGPPKGNNNNQNHQLGKNMQIDNGNKGGNNKKNNINGGQVGNNNNNNNNQGKGGQPTPQQWLQFQQQLQQMKGLQDLNLAQLKDMKMAPPPNQSKDPKAVKFAEEEGFCDDDDDYDDLDDDDDDDYDLDDDELDDAYHHLNKMKLMMGNAAPPKGVPNMMMLNGMMNGNLPQLMNAQKGMQNGAANAGGGNGKKGGNGGGGGGNAVPVQVLNGGGGGGNNEGKNGNGGKKGAAAGGNNNGGNQNQGGGGGKKGAGKNGGGLPQEANKNGGGNNGGPNGGNGGKKGNNAGGAPNGISEGFPRMGGPNGGGNIALQRGANMNMAMGQVGSLPMSHQMGNIPAVQGLPAAAAMNPGVGGSGGGYFQGAGPDVMPGNPYHQQYLAAMMNQQRPIGVGGNDQRYQPMMYARPPPAVNYMPPYPYPYPYPPPQPDPYTHFFSDENTSSCNVM